MKKALIICAAGMSSSMIAKKVTDFFADKDLPIELDSTTVSNAPGIIAKDKFDLYLVSPQAKMSYDNLKKEVEKTGKAIQNIPPKAYVPTDDGILELSKQVFTYFKPQLQAEKNGGQ